MHTHPADDWDVGHLMQLFPIDVVACSPPAGTDAFPGGDVLAIAAYRRRNYLVTFHWGLVPRWARDTSQGTKLINARAETLAQKPSFREAFEKRRCLIIAHGFIEWQVERDTKKQVFFTLPDKNPMGFAGLWDSWKSPQLDKPDYRSCTIVTVRACEAIRPFHHRMPAVLKSDHYSSWLDTRNRDSAGLSAILQNGVHTEFNATDPA